jgi:hypothetical protein
VKIDSSILHPQHTIDVANALVFLSDPLVGARFQYSSKQLILVGHSCGATMCALNLSTGAIQNQQSSSNSSLSNTDNDVILTEYEALLPQRVRECCIAFIGVCGLYDLELYTRTVPREYWSDLLYVFGDKQPPTEWDTPTRHSYRDTHCEWLLIDSSGDTWVPKSQQEAMQNHLEKIKAKIDIQYITLPSGAHNEVIECIGKIDTNKDVLLQPVSQFLNRVLLDLALKDAKQQANESTRSSFDESEYD